MSVTMENDYVKFCQGDLFHRDLYRQIEMRHLRCGKGYIRTDKRRNYVRRELRIFAPPDTRYKLH